ncbi:MAG: hypothetical protein WC055_10730 [Melioribacteraceae bacterium]
MTQSNMNFNQIFFSIVMMLFISTFINGQHRGDNLSFQGLNDFNNYGVKAAAMGGTHLAGSNDVNSIFGNPAGLIGLKSIQFTVSANSYQSKIWENQDYRSNRQFVTLPFYLSGLYVPNPANNGKWDYDAFFNDPTYIVADPTLGLDPYSSEAANWQYDKNEFIFNNVAMAIPFSLFDKEFIAAASYSRNSILDYDRNNTYLDPHIGFSGYGGLAGRVTAADDTINFNWFDYSRIRSGNLNQITLGVAAELFPFLKVGVSANIINGESDDFHGLNKIGYFSLIGGANSFKFSYDTLNTTETGTSKYSSFSLSFGTVITLNRINIGIQVKTPYTFEREYNLTQVIAKKSGNQTVQLTGTDKAKYPLGIAIGINFKPIDQFTLAFDLESTPYSKTEFELTSPDSTLGSYANQTIVRLGMEYKVLDFLSILAGFRNEPKLFIPDGSAEKESGPNSKFYTVGASLDFFFGRFDFAFEYNVMNYYDSYFSNTNYVTEKFTNVMLGYTYTF